MKRAILAVIVFLAIFATGCASDPSGPLTPEQCSLSPACMQGVRARLLMEQARAASAENDRLDAQRSARGLLVRLWMRMGKSYGEAHDLAANYTIDKAQARAIMDRVEATHARDLPAKLVAAYQASNFQLADQLLLAAYIFDQENAQAAKKSK